MPGATRITALDSAQKATLCDWYVGLLGGYGASNPCSNFGSIEVYKDQAVCVAAGLKFDCPLVTVAQLEECTKAQAPSGGCDQPEEHCHWLRCM